MSRTVWFGIIVGVAQGVAGQVFDWDWPEQIAVWALVTFALGIGHHIALTRRFPSPKSEGAQ